MKQLLENSIVASWVYKLTTITEISLLKQDGRQKNGPKRLENKNTGVPEMCLFLTFRPHLWIKKKTFMK